MAHTLLAPSGLRSAPGTTSTSKTQASGVPSLVFVSRAIPSNGSVYWEETNAMPGVGSHSRFRVARPGRLLVREPNGSLRTLIDGGAPSPATMNLIDVNAPDVSYDGTKIVFAGFPADEFNPSDTYPLADPDGWRIYVINANGTGLRQLTFSDQDNLDYSQFGGTAGGALRGYDDADPIWLPDGRIAFSSTRWPAFAQYSAARTTNLYVMNADGSNMHRITSEKSGADRPVVDPETGQIVFSRWWRNQRLAVNNMSTLRNNTYSYCCEGYDRKDGLTRIQSEQVGGRGFLVRNSWHLAAINPDGTGLRQFAGPHHKLDGAHAYGGSFSPDGSIVANYYPMANMSEAAGFGGLRRYRRGETEYEPIIGVTARYTPTYGEDLVRTNPPSFGIVKGTYAGEPAVLPDGRIVFSWAPDVNQDYGLYICNADGSNRTPLFDRPGTTELRAKPLQARPTPPILSDSVNTYASLLPPTEGGAYDQDGTFVFDALNVYANGPVDTIETNAPPVGSAAKIRFYTDFQRINWGSLEMLDWPILLGEKEINPDGSVRENAPANIQLFEQIRDHDGNVPVMSGASPGAAHVAGMNYGKPGQTFSCVGCHAGHTMIPPPANEEEAKWSNLAPGAQIRASSSRNSQWNFGLIDRRVMKGKIYETWASAQGQTENQWVELVFPEPITIRNVRLWNIRFTSGSTLQVDDVTVRLGMPGAADWVASAGAQAISPSGTDVNFDNVKAQTVRVEFNAVSGLTSDRLAVASLAEIEVIARAGEGGATTPPPPSAFSLTGVSPNQIPFGNWTKVTLSGSGFKDGATVGLGNGPGRTPYVINPSVVDDKTITAQVWGMQDSQGAWDVTVTNPGGATATLAGALTVGNTPSSSELSLSGLSPNQIPFGSWNRVTISGSGFHSGAAVSLGNGPGRTPYVVNPSVVDDKTITIQVWGMRDSQGSWDVTVANADGSAATLPGALTVGNAGASAFSLTGTSPNRIVSGPWNKVTISGTGFKAGATVSLSNGPGRTPVLMHHNVIDETTMTVQVWAPSTAVGYWDVTVTNGDGATATLQRGLNVALP